MNTCNKNESHNTIMGGTDEKADKCYHTIMYWDFTFNNYPVSYLMDAGSCLMPDGWIGRKDIPIPQIDYIGTFFWFVH